MGENQIQCAATTKTGNRCKNNALPGLEFCRVHQPAEGKSASSEPGTQAAAQAGNLQDEPSAPDEEMKKELVAELDEMISQIKEEAPDYTPPPFSPKRLIQLLGEGLEHLSPHIRLGVLEKLRSLVGEDLLDIDTWKGIWFMLNYTLEYQSEFVRHRVTGDYETDDWGLDIEVLDAARPILEALYNAYWRIETTGMEQIPEEGAAILVANHSGQLPWDSVMLATAVYKEHPAQRLVRNLNADWSPALPFVSTMLTRLGQVHATEENGLRLLEQGALISVFPEGVQGVSKLFKERYRLASFGGGGFVRMALKNHSPMIPVSIVGAEETYISLHKSRTIARLIGLPYFPVSLTFPWLGPLGLVPLPTKWYLDIGEPIPTDIYEEDAAENPTLVSQLTDQVRNVVQEMVFERLAERKSIFFG